jgi:hypothetical protein
MGRSGPMTEDHKAKIAAALRQYAASPASHLPSLQRSGPDHPNWRGGIKPAYDQRVARAAHGDACERCGSTRYVEVHHKDENRRNSDPSNLEVLCRSCHARVHEHGGDVRHVTHCPQGHAYTPENTYLYTNKDGGTARHCRACRRADNRARYGREKEATQ